MKEKDKLKELLFEMMKVEIEKMDVENHNDLVVAYYGEKQAKIAFEYNILNLDEKGYELGLEFGTIRKDLSDRGDFGLTDCSKYPNATEIAAINLLGKYHLEFPPYWEIGKGGTKYFPLEIVEDNYAIFIAKIEDMVKKGLISEFEKRRLILASEFLLNLVKIHIINKEQEIVR